MIKPRKFFQEAIIHKNQVVKGFHVVYFLIISSLILAGIFTYLNRFEPIIYELGVLSGNLAVLFFCLTLTPGIARRFGIQNIGLTFLMTIRRQLGVTCFSLAFLHYANLRLLPLLLGSRELILPIPVFEILGVSALYAMFPLWITSNDFSVKKLKKWWHRLHSLVYFIVWLLFAHVALQEFGPSAILLGTYGLAEVFSFGYIAGKHKMH